MDFEKAINSFLHDTLPGLLPRLLMAGLLFVLGLWLSKVCARFISKALERGHADAGLVTFMRSIIRIGLQVVALFTALLVLGAPIGNIITLISAGAVAIAVALRDSMANVASGIIILFTKPFAVGDFIEVDGSGGTVSEIMIMSTRVLTADNKRVVFPNSMLTSNKITNFSQEENRRMDMLFTIGYDADIEKACHIVLDCAKETGNVLPDPEPRCVVKEQGQHGVVLGTIMWCKRENYLDTTYEMNKLVKYAFDQAGIYIPVFELNIAQQ